MADNNFGIALGGGAYGGAFGGLGISNFTVLTVGAILLAGLTAHILTRRNARYDHIKWNNKMNKAAAITDKQFLHHKGHMPPMNYEDAASDLYAFTVANTLPDTAVDNEDRIKECIRRHRSKIRDVMDSVYKGRYSEDEGHQHIHGMAQYIMDELDLPHRDSVQYMPYAMSGFE